MIRTSCSPDLSPVATLKNALMGPLETSHPFTVRAQLGRWMPNRGGNTLRLNGTISQSGAMSIGATAARRPVRASTETQIAPAPKNKIMDRKPASASKSKRKSTPPRTCKSNMIGNPAARTPQAPTRQPASLPSTISALFMRVSNRKSRVRRSRSLAIE